MTLEPTLAVGPGFERQVLELRFAAAMIGQFDRLISSPSDPSLIAGYMMRQNYPKVPPSWRLRGIRDLSPAPTTTIHHTDHSPQHTMATSCSRQTCPAAQGRIISPDRPVYGKTTPYGCGAGGEDCFLAGSIATDASTISANSDECQHIWTDAVSELLRHLDISHVSLSTQSDGTVYALDLILHHPEILRPQKKPHIEIGALWIHPSQSGALAMSVTHPLPKMLIEQTDKLASLASTASGPVMSKYFATSDILLGLLGAKSSPSFIKKLIGKWPLKGHCSLECSDLFTRRGYYTLVPRLAAVLRSPEQRLVVEVFLGETDYIIGDTGSKGPEWVNQCRKSISEADDGRIDLSSIVVKVLIETRRGTYDGVFLSM
ncbi:hypothetical protein MAC_04504 [Metarhizium acridum CQMa 102]|uniref:Uncharacterized protein n=1 Tax=Metarhizium acridum (strain CQMa 102) TaxID=655827 RepID=E9E3R0_METAQ|nr:uncharacterized protein MAC_04504 [Metarhizium acridum CQMa 102]EFY89485.1 hypothetical protein MAC_04504 [Metarhizium acridum CQMa 102]